jgi:uncharacterized protein
MDRNYKKIVIWCIEICSRTAKTLFQIPPGCCRFYPSCTEFAKEAVEKLPLTMAIALIIKRILKCHPFHNGGFDPVIEETIIWKDGCRRE